MRLSEAIRIGASWSKQIFGKLKNHHGTCALGAAIEGAFGDKYTVKMMGNVSCLIPEFEYKFPYADKWMASTMFCCQSTGKREIGYLKGFIMHLNDHHLWTRDKIADWVEQEENAHPEWFKNEKKQEVKKEVCHVSSTNNQ